MCMHVRRCGYELALVTLLSKTRKINIFEQVRVKGDLLGFLDV